MNIMYVGGLESRLHHEGDTTMAKKAELLEKAKELKLEVTEKNTIAEIEKAIADAEHHEVREATVAKAGKRSEKALKEVEVKEEKESRKEAGDTTPQAEEAVSHSKRGPVPKIRPQHERKGKAYRKAYEKIDHTANHTVSKKLFLSLPKQTLQSLTPVLKYMSYSV
jgi:hypothetical protein